MVSRVYTVVFLVIVCAPSPSAFPIGENVASLSPLSITSVSFVRFVFFLSPSVTWLAIRFGSIVMRARSAVPTTAKSVFFVYDEYQRCSHDVNLKRDFRVSILRCFALCSRQQQKTDLVVDRFPKKKI